MYAHLRMVNLLSEAVYGEGGEGPVPDAGHVTVQRDGLRLWERCNQTHPILLHKLLYFTILTVNLTSLS